MKAISTIAILALVNNVSAIYLTGKRPYNQSEDPLFSDDGDAVATSLLSIKAAEKSFGT